MTHVTWSSCMHQTSQQKRTCKIMQDSCKIVQESCMQDLHGTCTRYVPFLARFLHYLARSCTYLARNGARFCKKCCKNNYLQVWSFLHIFLQDLARIVQDCARIMQEKGHIACTCQASFACKILAWSCKFVFAGFSHPSCWSHRAPQQPPLGQVHVLFFFTWKLEFTRK